MRATVLVSDSIVVSPRGIANGTSTIINDGAPFGPDTGTTATSGIQEAVTYAGGAGIKTVKLLAGTFVVKLLSAATNAILVPANVIVELDEATVQVNSASSTMTNLFNFGSASALLGVGTLDGSSTSITTNLITLTSASGSVVDGLITLQNAVVGVFVSAGKSIAVRRVQPIFCSIVVDSTADVTLADIYLSLNAAGPLTNFPVKVYTSGSTNPTNVVIQNVVVDGGSAYTGALMNIHGANNVLVSNCTLLNTSNSAGDGLGIIQCFAVTVTGVVVQGCYYGIKVFGSGSSNFTAATLQGCNVSQCHGPGIVIGDPTTASTSPTADVSVVGCVAFGNGLSGLLAANARAGILVIASGATTVSHVIVKGCVCISNLTYTQRYGVSLVTASSSSIVQNVTVAHNDVAQSSVAGVLVSATSGSTLSPVSVFGNMGYNPQQVTRPTLTGLTTYTTAAQPYAQDVNVATTTGTTLTAATYTPGTLRGGSSTSLPLVLPMTVHLEPGDELALTWSSSAHLPVITIIPY